MHVVEHISQAIVDDLGLLIHGPSDWLVDWATVVGLLPEVNKEFVSTLFIGIERKVWLLRINREHWACTIILWGTTTFGLKAQNPYYEDQDGASGDGAEDNPLLLLPLFSGSIELLLAETLRLGAVHALKSGIFFVVKLHL